MADGKLARLELYADDMIDYLVDRQRTYGKRRNDVTQETTGKFKSFLNPALEYQFSEQAGRFALAKTEIKVAERIIVETPHASVLLEEFSRSHCHHCLNRLELSIPCDGCTNAIFCSEVCKLKSQGYHKYECEHLSSLWRSGLSATHQLGLRIITQRSLGYFLTVKDELENGVGVEEWKKLSR
jgi:SET and MYND domain-containing protein 4